MRARTTLLLLLAVAVVGAALWLSDRARRSERANVQLGSPLLTWRVDGVKGLSLAAGDLRLVLTKQDDEWYLQQPVRARADRGQVERILSVLEALTREEIVTPDQREQLGLGLEDYGLSQPWARWTIDDGAEVRELYVGHDAPLGDLIYVKLARGRDVVATSQSLRRLVPESIDGLRDARVMGGAVERVSRVELHRAGQGFVRLARQDGQWLLRQPVEGRADAGIVQRLLDELFVLRAQEFVWDGDAAVPSSALAAAPAGPGGTAAAGDPRLEQFGLAADEATARLQVWLDGDLVAYELLVGKPTGAADGRVYAMRRDVNSVFSIQPTQLEWLAVNADDLRERDVFGVAPGAVRSVRVRQDERKLELQRDAGGLWQFVEPMQSRADDQAVDELVQGLTQWQTLAFVSGTETDVADVALSNALCTVRLSTEQDAPVGIGANGHRWTGDADALRVGVVTGDVPAVYVRFDSSPEIRRLAIGARSVLGADPADPLAFLDRTMLAVPADDVQRITLERGGQVQSVTRSGAGWRPADGVTNGVARDVVEDLLFFVSNLRAARVEALNATNLPVYGLEPGASVLTLGLKGETGIQKSIVLGGHGRADTVYAMVKGQDIVFTVSAAVGDLLVRDLWTAP